MVNSPAKSPRNSRATASIKRNKRFLDPDPIALKDPSKEQQQQATTSNTSSNQSIPLEPPSSSSIPKRHIKSVYQSASSAASSTSALPLPPSLDPNLLSAAGSSRSTSNNKSSNKSPSKPNFGKGISITGRTSTAREEPSPVKRQTRAATRLLEADLDGEGKEIGKGKGRMLDDDIGKKSNGMLQTSSGNITDVTDVTQKEPSQREPIGETTGSGKLGRSEGTNPEDAVGRLDRDSSPLTDLGDEEEGKGGEEEGDESLDSDRSAILEDLHSIHDEASQEDDQRAPQEAFKAPKTGTQDAGGMEEVHQEVEALPSQVLAASSSPPRGSLDLGRPKPDVQVTGLNSSTLQPRTSSQGAAIQVEEEEPLNSLCNKENQTLPAMDQVTKIVESGPPSRSASIPVQKSFHSHSSSDAGRKTAGSGKRSGSLEPTPTKANRAPPQVSNNSQAGSELGVQADPEMDVEGADSSTIGGASIEGVGALVDAEMEDGDQLLADLDANIFSDVELSSPIQQRRQQSSPLRKSPAKKRRLGGQPSPNGSPSRDQQRRMLQRTASKANQMLGVDPQTKENLNHLSPPASDEEFELADVDDDLFDALEDIDMDVHSLSPTISRTAKPTTSNVMPPPVLPGLTSGAGVALRSSSPNSIQKAQDRISQTGSSPSRNRIGLQTQSFPLHGPSARLDTGSTSLPVFSVGGDLSRPASRPSAAAMDSAQKTFSSSPIPFEETESSTSANPAPAEPVLGGFTTGRNKKLKPSESALRKAALSYRLIEAEVEKGLPPPSPKSRSSSRDGGASATTSRKGKEKETEIGKTPNAFETPRAGAQTRSDQSRTPFAALPHGNVAGSPKSKSANSNTPSASSMLGGASFSKASQRTDLPGSSATTAGPLDTPKPIRAISGGLRKSFATPSRVGPGQGVPSSSFASGNGSRLGKRLPSTPATSADAVTPRRPNPLLSSGKSISFGRISRTAGGANRPVRLKFKTPFKNGIAPPALASTPRSASKLSSGLSGGTPSSLSSNPIALSKGEARAVFNLSSRPRQSLSEYGIRPEQVSVGEARFHGVSDDVFVILEDPSMAALYSFTDEDDNDLGPTQAHQMLRKAGAIHASQQWVTNHWSLIVWKLAAITRHKPKEDEHWFTWEEVCRQLKYRYEREINLAQRSAIRRIQETDSSASHSMVLFVSKVYPFIRTAPQVGERTDPAAPKTEEGLPELELSDGWYRIRTTIDETLARALNKGRIKVGVKLAITGARLSDTSGASPLEATSTLAITGNSTSLARWDARLGFVGVPFVATLRSLSADGGTVPRMDIVLTRVFDHAWVDINPRGGDGGNPRGDQEEARLQNEWENKREREMEKLEAEWSKSTEQADVLREMVEQEAEDCGSDYGLEPFEAAELFFEKMKDSPSPSQYLRKNIDSQASILPALVEVSRRYVAEVQEEARSEIQCGIESLCPPRKVRDFRVVRFMDASVALKFEKELNDRDDELRKVKIEEGEDSTVVKSEDGSLPAIAGSSSKKVTSPVKRQKGERRPEARSVQLQVWDVNAFGKNSLKVGNRYTVTNLMPTQKSSWRGPDEEADVMLNTRRDTRWRANGVVRIA